MKSTPTRTWFTVLCLGLVTVLAGCNDSEEKKDKAKARMCKTVDGWFIRTMTICNAITNDVQKNDCLQDAQTKNDQITLKKLDACQKLEECDDDAVKDLIKDIKEIIMGVSSLTSANVGEPLGPEGQLAIDAVAISDGPLVLDRATNVFTTVDGTRTSPGDAVQINANSRYNFGGAALIGYAVDGDPITYQSLGGSINLQLSPSGGGLRGKVVGADFSFRIRDEVARTTLLAGGQTGSIDVDASGNGVMTFHSSLDTSYVPNEVVWWEIPFTTDPSNPDKIHWNTNGVVDASSVFPVDRVFELLGGSLTGSAGDPVLTGVGRLAGGESVTLNLNFAHPSATASLVVGNSAVNVPFKGGMLVPNPVTVIPLGTDAFGNLGLTFAWPAGPAGVDYYFQYWIADPTTAEGCSASNAILSRTE